MHADFFQIDFPKILSGIPSECQTVWIQIGPDIFVRPYLDPICLKRFKTKVGTSRESEQSLHTDAFRFLDKSGSVSTFIC